MKRQSMETAPRDGEMIILIVEGTGGGEIPAKWMGSWWGFDRPTLGTPVAWRRPSHISEKGMI